MGYHYRHCCSVYIGHDKQIQINNLFSEVVVRDLFSCCIIQAFPIQPYARVDDIVVYSLFATKRQPKSYYQLNPTAISDIRAVTAEEGIDIAKICYHGIGQACPTQKSCHEVSLCLQEAYPCLFDAKEIPILGQ
jgi:hypothetical protein